MYVTPDGRRSFFHKSKVEEYVGGKLHAKDGFNGQVQRRTCS